MFSEEVLKQREKVQKECIKLQTLVDAELDDSTFIWNPGSKFVQVTFDIFRKEKRTRKEDEEEEYAKGNLIMV
jgi:hypothetical protein